MRAEGAFDLHLVDILGPGPSFGAAQDDRRPSRKFTQPVAPRVVLDRANRLVTLIEYRRELAMHHRGLFALEEVHVVTVSLEQLADVLILAAPEHRRTCNLVAVEMQDWQHRAVADR